MKKFRLAQLLKIAAENVDRSELAILKLIDAFESGEIRAAAARRMYRSGLRQNYWIDYNRYEKLCSAYGVGCAVSDLVRFDDYFIY